MFGGKARTPLVIRGACPAPASAPGAQHSQTLHPLFTMVPGLKVVMPSNPYDAKGLLIQAIRDDDPVIFLESQAAVRSRGRGAGRGLPHPVRRGERRAGGQATSPSSPSGAMVPRALAAAERLAKDGIQRRGHRPAHHLAAGRGHHPGERRKDRPVWWSSTRARRAVRSPPTSPPSWPSKAFSALKAPDPHRDLPAHAGAVRAGAGGRLRADGRADGGGCSRVRRRRGVANRASAPLIRRPRRVAHPFRSSTAPPGCGGRRRNSGAGSGARRCARRR